MKDILETLRGGQVELPPLEIELVGIEPEQGGERSADRPDAYIDIRWSGRSHRFVAEIKAQATPKTFQSALDQVQRAATAREMLPLLIVPYLAPERLAALEDRGISGIDLCGNGVVAVPGELLVFRTGGPNRFPAGQLIRNVYRGTSSQVARVFLARPKFETVQEVMDEIVQRGGRVSLSTVSKALRALDEDLVIRREGRSSELLQADELLDRLARSYRPAQVSASRKYRWTRAGTDPLRKFGEGNQQLVLTGAASVDRYSIMPREKAVQCYCTDLEAIESRLGDQVEETLRFPDLELIETQDPQVYFDRRATGAVAIASPVQSWLELQTGDKRQQDASTQVKERILEELRCGGWSSK